jgi:hypothetical protein
MQMNFQAIFSVISEAGFGHIQGKFFKTSEEKGGIELFFSKLINGRGNTISIIIIEDKIDLEIYVGNKLSEFTNLDENQLMLELKKL